MWCVICDELLGMLRNTRGSLFFDPHDAHEVALGAKTVLHCAQRMSPLTRT